MKRLVLVAVAAMVVGAGALVAGIGPLGAQTTSASPRSAAAPTTAPDPRPGPVVPSPQFGIPGQTDVFSIASDGTVQVQWVQGAGKWNGPLAISSPGLAPQGAHLAVSNQLSIPNQTDVFVVDGSGTVQVLWVQGAGKWNGPLAISSPGLAAPGATLAASNQFGIPNQTDLFMVDANGTVQVLWVQGAGKWHGPLAISPAGLAPPSFAGNGLATSTQFGVPSQTDVFVVDNTGRVDVLWVAGAGVWNGPLAISQPNLAPAGSGLTASNQFGISNQTDVFLVDFNGIVDVLWVDGPGTWRGPMPISKSGLAPSAVFLAASNQFGIPNQTDVFVVGSNGAVDVLWVEGAGTWTGPLGVSNPSLTIPGLGLTSSNQLGLPNQTDVFVVDQGGATDVLWVDGSGPWNGPLAI